MIKYLVIFLLVIVTLWFTANPRIPPKQEFESCSDCDFNGFQLNMWFLFSEIAVLLVFAGSGITLTKLCLFSPQGWH